MTQMPTNCCNDKGSDITQKLLAAMDGILGNADKLEKFINGTQEETVDLGGIDTDTLRRFKFKIDGILDGAIARAEARMQLLVQAARAEADRVTLLIDYGAITSGEYNNRYAWVNESTIYTDGILQLPGHYLPGRDTLLLHFDGVVCTPKKPGVEASGDYQYEEIGNLDELSNQVKLTFTAPAGSVFDMWSVSLAAEQLAQAQAAANAALDSATAAAGSEAAAGAFATGAAQSAVSAGNSADTASSAAGIASGAASSASSDAASASASKDAAAASEEAAAIAVTQAQDFAGNSADSAADAASSASGAAGLADAASESAASAAASESAAGESATAADESAQAAQASAEIAGTAASGTKDRGTVVNALTSQGTGYGITGLTVADGGAGYEAGDALIIGDAESLVDAIFVVNAVDSGGAVTEISISKSGVWASSDIGADLTISGGHGTGFDPSFIVGQVAFTTLNDILHPIINDTAYVVQDEIHDNATYLWKYADYNGDGTANWVPITSFASTIKQASTTQAGITRYSSPSQVLDNNNNDTAVTPSALAARSATEARTGLVELATSAEALAGTDTSRAITSATLKSVLASKRKDEVLSAVLAADAAWTTPAYIVSSKKLQIYLYGELAVLGTSTSNGFYKEVGGAGASSTSITIFDALPVGALLTAVVSA
jgi:hypothetical protein